MVSYAPDALWQAQQVKDGIWIELVVPVALLNPEPVTKRDQHAQAQRWQESDGVRGREEEEVGHEAEGGNGVEGEIGGDGQWRRPVWENELRVDLSCWSAVPRAR